MQKRLAVAVALVVVAAMAAPGGGALRAQERAQTVPARFVMALPMVGSDTTGKFGIGAPNSAGTTCTRVGSYTRSSGWSGTFGADPERFTFDSGERLETAWRFPVAITASRADGVVPLRAWLNLRSVATAAEGRGESQVVSRIGGVLPAPAPGGGWVVDEFVREPEETPETMEVQSCIQWGPQALAEIDLPARGPGYAITPGDALTLLAAWQPAAGAAAVGGAPIVELPGNLGLLSEADGPVMLANPLAPAGSLSLRAFPAELPAAPRVETDAIYRETGPGRTTVTFELKSATGGFEPTIRCETPVGVQQFTLPYRVLPGVPLPFQVHFSSPSLSPNADLDDFTCEQTAIKGTLGTPAQGGVITSVEDVQYNRETRELETLVGLYNPSALPVEMAGWSVAAALYVGGRVVGFQDEGVDSITLAPGGYARVVVRQPSALAGFDPVAIGDAFSRNAGMGTLRVISGVFRRGP